MKTIILVLGTTVSLLSSSKVSAREMDMANPSFSNISFIEKKEEAKTTILCPREKVKVYVEFIVGENGKYYVTYINSTHPEIHYKICNMIYHLPVLQENKDHQNYITIEYEI
ncbi:MAG: hypothetical protein M9958_07195 [Chitinophagales bacterium]|nr:hypothetical protein [Chitinophagales bacterium]